MIILPLVLIAFIVRKLVQAALSILIHILDYAFPILLQVMKFPLFTVRIVGDGVVAFLKGIVGFLPVSSTKREEWRTLVSQGWAWLRQKISFKVFEEAIHHAFEGGMAWVFRNCRTLTPRNALLVIAGAVLWLPLSFTAGTAVHAVLIAKAASLPPWMQLLHVVATVIAKSKLLVLPVYPAAWPQAKKHPFVQSIFQLSDYLTNLYLAQKTRYRYRQTETVVAETADVLGLSHGFARLVTGLSGLTAWIGRISLAAMRRMVKILSGVALIGPVIRGYAERYKSADNQDAKRLSERASELFERWSIKFSAEFYEAREKEEAAKRQTSA